MFGCFCRLRRLRNLILNASEVSVVHGNDANCNKPIDLRPTPAYLKPTRWIADCLLAHGHGATKIGTLWCKLASGRTAD
jgi:hypothetical protein